jgi:class 3 adenylate cyclase/tetratricopeptide (TPR) repeat protein
VDVGGWLRGLGLGKYEAAFLENGIGEAVLPHLTVEDLKELGVATVGDRRMLLAAIAALATSTPSEQSGPQPSPALPTRAPELSAERRPITVMFCDLVGSTRIAAKLDPEDWRNLVSAYLDEASAAITSLGGHVLKRLGDGLMALFGFPQAQENDAERAVRAGLAIQRALAEVNARNAGKGAPELTARIGIELGPVVVDATGEVFGDAPNVAARVQAAAEPGSVLVTLNVQRQVAGLFVAEEQGARELKGVPEPVQLFRIIRTSSGRRRGGARALTPFIGREEEVGLLARRWESVRAGEGQLVLIVGEPGLGKSRLIEEFHSRLAETPHTWVEWSASQLLQNTPLHPIAEWGRFRFGANAPPEQRLADLENTVRLIGLDPVEHAPLLAPLMDIPLPSSRVANFPPEELRRKQLAAMTNMVLAGARSQPAVVAFEDLHWADPTSLDLLRGLAERGAQAPLFLIATSRPEFRPSWDMRAHHSAISLAPLKRAQVYQMVGELASRHALPKDVIEGVSERTGGVPLFVEEVTRLLLERGAEGGAQAIPPTLQQSLAARLDRLGAAREIAQIGAVLGRDFAYALLRDVAETDEPALQASLERLAEADILFVEGAPPQATYRFKHALIQDAAYESLLKSRRQALHRRTGEALRDQFAATAAAEPELLAHHFTRAGMTEAAIEWWGAAGQRSLARSALLEGVEQLKRVLGQIATLPATADLRREEIKLHVAFANALGLTGDFVGAKKHYDQALAIYDPAEHRPLATRSGRDIGVTLLAFRSNCVWLLGYPAASLNDAQRALKDARETGQPTTLMYALLQAAFNHIHCGNYADANAAVDELIALADDKGTPYFKAVGIAARGWLFARIGKASDAIQAIASVWPHFGQLERLFMNHGICGIWQWLTRNLASSTMLGVALKKVERSKEKWAEAEANRIAGEIALKSLAPDTETAEKYFDRALAVARQQQAKSWELRAAISLARLWRDQGKLPQSRELLAPVYSWFTEGFDTRDLKDAKALLEELTA